MIGLPKAIHPDVREMDALRQKVDSQLNAYLNSYTPQSKLLNKPPPKEDIERLKELARSPPQRMNTISQSVYERNRNWVHFCLTRYMEQLKVFTETGQRYRFYTPEMLGKEPAKVAGGTAELTPAQEAQRRVNRRLHGVEEEGQIPEGTEVGKHAPMGASAPQQGAADAASASVAPAAPRMQRKVLIKRIIRKKADGTQEVIEQRTVVEVPVGDSGATPRPAVAAKPASPAPPQPKPPAAPKPPRKPPAPRPVDRELDDFFKKYNLK